MKKPATPVLFFDTNQWKSLSIEKEITLILNACKAGNLSVCLSKWVIYEYARQYFKRQRDAFERQKNAIFPQFELIDKLSIYKAGEILLACHFSFESMFREYGVNVIEHCDDLEAAAREIISSEQSYFSSGNSHDQRDARIFAAALMALHPNNSIVLTEDAKLNAEFERRGFTVKPNARDFVRQLQLGRTGTLLNTPDFLEILRNLRSGDGENFPDNFHSTLLEVDATYAELFLPGAVIERPPRINLEVALQRVDELGADDKETKIKILSYVHWFAPISKDDLASMLQERQISEKAVFYFSDSLVAAGSIIDTGTHFLPGKDGVCAAIGDSRVDELVELLKVAENEV